MAIYSGALNAGQNILESNKTVGGWLDSKIKDVKTANINDVSFAEQIDTNDGTQEGIVWRGFDITTSTEVKLNSTISRSPIEDGTSIVQHISKPIETIVLIGEVTEIAIEIPQKLGILEGNLTSALSTAGRFAPNLIQPAQAKILQGIDKVNKLKNQAEGFLGEARSFYSLIKNFAKADFKRRYIAFAEKLKESQRQKILFSIRVNGVELKDYAISTLIMSQEPKSNIDMMKFNITFEKINRAVVLTTINKNEARKVSREIAQKEAVSVTKNSKGKLRSLLVQGLDAGGTFLQNLF